MKKILTIAGSDCSGGAGIQADLKTMTVLKCYGMSAITALTAQNTLGVAGILDINSNFINLQLKTIYKDIKPDAVKIGMVSSVKIVDEIFSFLKTKNQKNIVLDPVMISTSNSKLITTPAISQLQKKLFKISTIITPNIPEAQWFCGFKIKNAKDTERAAIAMSQNTKAAILIKGGHNADNADDLLYFNKKFYWFKAKKINNPNTHGTGCTFSSAIACYLAKGNSVLKSVKLAKKYVHGAIENKNKIGHGHGPLNHMYKI